MKHCNKLVNNAFLYKRNSFFSNLTKSSIPLIKDYLHNKTRIKENIKFLKCSLHCFSENNQRANLKHKQISEKEFIIKAEEEVDDIYNHLDNDKYLDKLTTLELHDGVLEITINKKHFYVINLQRPNKQIWLSSPISGPQRFEYYENENNEMFWINIRNNKSIRELLNEEINKLMENTGSNVIKL